MIFPSPCDDNLLTHHFFFIIVKLALNGIQILLNYEVVPPSEACNILRVLLVQVVYLHYH